MKITITHKGPAHRDDFLSICCLLATYLGVLVYRRDPETADMVDPEIMVVDQGGELNPARGNFDHHQLGRDEDPTCSLQLLNEHFGWGLEVYDWYGFTSLLDSKGPVVAAKSLGTDMSGLLQTLSPVEKAIMQEFSEVSGDVELGQHDWMGIPGGLKKVMQGIGHEILSYAATVKSQYEELSRIRDLIKVDGVTAIRPPVDREWDPKVIGMVRDDLIADGHDVGISVSKDIRGGGLSLYRYADHPRVDFSSLEGEDGVIFAHKGGFIAKLAAGVDPLPLLEAAIVP